MGRASYTTAAEDAAKIRAAYKARGWNARHVSVRSETYSMGSSITVRLKSLVVDEAEARRIAEAEEQIDRCKVTGEILSGANRYVSVGWSREARAELLAPWLGPIKQAAARVAGNVHAEIPGAEGWTLARDGIGWLQLWGPSSETGVGRVMGRAYPGRDGHEELAFLLALGLRERARAA